MEEARGWVVAVLGENKCLFESWAVGAVNGVPRLGPVEGTQELEASEGSVVLGVCCSKACFLALVVSGLSSAPVQALGSVQRWSGSLAVKDGDDSNMTDAIC